MHDLSERLDPLDSRGDTILAVWLDALDVPHLQLHRLLDAQVRPLARSSSTS